MLRVVVVVRAVEVRRHHGDVVRAVLSVEVRAVLQARDLRERVALVRRLERAREQARLRHRLRGELRVDARRAEEEQLAAAVPPRGVDRVHLEHRVVVEEVRRRGRVRRDAADLRRGEEDVVRPLLREEGVRRALVAQVEFRVRADDDVLEAAALQRADDGGADHPAVSGDVDLGVLFHGWTWWGCEWPRSLAEGSARMEGTPLTFSSTILT